MLTVVKFAVFEVSVRPSSVQHQQTANVVWPVAGLLVVPLWAWFFVRGRHAK
jgi:hypothetical protein